MLLNLLSILLKLSTKLPTPPTNLVELIVKLIFYAFGIVAVINIIIAAANMIANGSKPEVVVNSRNRIIYSLIGVVVSILAIALANYIKGNI